MNFFKFDIDKISNLNDVARIPPVHAFFFKNYKIFTVKEKHSVTKRTSSGTSGQKSLMLFDKETVISSEKIIVNIIPLSKLKAV